MNVVINIQIALYLGAIHDFKILQENETEVNDSLKATKPALRRFLLNKIPKTQFNCIFAAILTLFTSIRNPFNSYAF